MKPVENERILYGFWLSPYMATVAHVLKESNIPFRYERVSPFVGDTQSDQHIARNPLGKIPSLEDSNGLIVSESQAICRYISRTYPRAQQFYPCADPVLCAPVDTANDFLTFSISGPFFNWFVVGAYYPQAFKFKTERESEIYSSWSLIMIKGALGRLIGSAKMSPFLLGPDPCLADFHLFHILELGKTFSQIFEMPLLNLMGKNEALQNFYTAMSSRTSTREILQAQAGELALTRHEIFEEFGKAMEDSLVPARAALKALFGHEV